MVEYPATARYTGKERSSWQARCAETPWAVWFEWDADKAVSNFTKHGVAFSEASTVFGDPLATTVVDPDHSDDEERWLTTGESAAGRILIVWHTNRADGIRIIGARQATPNERRSYEHRE